MAKIAQVRDDTLLANFIKRPHKKSKIYNASEEPQPPQGVEPHPTPVQEEAPVQEEELKQKEEMKKKKT